MKQNVGEAGENLALGALAKAGVTLQDESNESYYGAYIALLRVIKFGAAVILVLTFALLYIVNKGHPEDRFFAMSFDGKKLPLVSLSEPSVNVNAMLSWASMAATQIMTFGFNDVNQKMAYSRIYFTDVGWESFNDALKKSYLLKTILSHQQIMTAMPRAVPTIVYQGFRDGDYVWDIKVPIVLTVRAGGKSKSARPGLIMTVVQVPTEKNARGLGIKQWMLY